MRTWKIYSYGYLIIIAALFLPSKWKTASIVLVCAALLLFLAGGIVHVVRMKKGNTGNPSPLQRAEAFFRSLYPEHHFLYRWVMDIKGQEFIIGIDYNPALAALHPLWKVFSVKGDHVEELDVKPGSKYWVCRK
jgi:hypothetical protein